MIHPQHPPPCDASALAGGGPAAALEASEVKNLRDRRLALTISSSAGGPNGRIEMCTIVPATEVATSGNLAATSVWSSDNIFPMCNTLKNDGAGGFSAGFSGDHALQNASLTRPSVIVGAKCIVLRDPVIKRNVIATSVVLGGGELGVDAAGGGAGVDVEVRVSSKLVGAGAGSESTGRLGGSVACSCRGDE